MAVSLLAGPWDQIFGGGNIPAFMLASVCALLGGIFAAILLPKPEKLSTNRASLVASMH